VNSVTHLFVGKILHDFDSKELGNRHKYISVDGRFIYHIAIIDYLQAFDMEKYAENVMKIWLYQRDGQLISAVHPSLYAKRFNAFMREMVIID
jgi:glycogen debranching enzyme